MNNSKNNSAELKDSCPHCGGNDYETQTVRANGWHKYLSILLSATALTHPKHETYKTICSNCKNNKG